MSRTRFAVTAAAVMISLSAITVSAQRMFADVSGKWAFTVDAPQGQTNSLATFKQEGEALTGTLEIEQMGTRPITGSVKGDTVRFAFTLDMNGQTLELQSTGVLKDKDSMAGQMELVGMGAFPWTAKRSQ